MYKHMTKEVFERFNRAAEAFAAIPGDSKCLTQTVVSFYERFLDSYVHDCKNLPSRCMVVYVNSDIWGNYGNYERDYDFSVNTRLVELRKVKITVKSIVFDDGYVLPFSKIKFFVW